VIFVELPNAVASAVPFQLTTDFAVKLLPVATSAKVAPLATAVAGEIELSTGAFELAGEVIVNGAAWETCPASDTTTGAVPVAAISFAGTEAVSRVASPKVVARAVPFQSTTDFEVKPVPLTVMVKAADPATMESGDKLEIAGGGDTTVKFTGEEVRDPVETVIEDAPAAATSFALTFALRLVALPNVVASAEPFQSIAEVAVKFDPLTVNRNWLLPATVDEGANDLITGGGWLMVKPAGADLALPAATVTAAVPAWAIRSAVTGTVSLVALANAVGRDVPFHCTIDDAVKPVPFTVSVKEGPPAVADDGVRLPIAGFPGLVMAKVSGVEVCPLSETLTEADPDTAINPAPTVAVNVVGFARLVVRELPFH
jgi:hypothetical protein